MAASSLHSSYNTCSRSRSSGQSCVERALGTPSSKRDHRVWRQASLPSFLEARLSERSPQKSFPSGHVAMGFYYLSLLLLAKRAWLFYSALFLILFWGVGLMVTRVVQGGHFVSDVLASFVLMWLIACVADRCCKYIRLFQ